MHVYPSIEKLRTEPKASAYIVREGDVPRLHVNGEETYPVAVWSWDLEQSLQYFREAGVRIVHTILGMNSAWPEPGRYDFSGFDRLFDKLLAQHPDAYFLPRVLFDVPDWWKDAYPDQLVRCAVPIEPKDKRQYRAVKYSEEGGWNWGIQFREPSLASDRWCDDMESLYAAFLRHIEVSPLAGRIIGYQIGGGIYGEWHYFLSEFMPDTGKAVREKLGFVPDAQTRLQTTHGLLRDPEKEKPVIDYYRRFHEEIIAGVITKFARITKEETDGRVLCGIFYGYQLENVWIHEGGHLAPEKILNCPDIDFFASPYSYQTTNIPDRPWWEHDIVDDNGNYLGRTRGVGGDAGYRVMLESLKRHGKLFFVEIDPGTYLEPPPVNPDGSGGTDIEKEQCMIGGVGSTTKVGTRRILRRDLGRVFVNGNGGWLFDFGPTMKTGKSWYADRPIIDEVKCLIDLGTKNPDLQRSSIAEIAAVYDAKSFFVTRHWYAEAPFPKGGASMDFFSYNFLDSQARALHRLGAPVDYLYRFDLNRKDFSDFKLLMMVNAFYLTDGEIKFLTEELTRSNITVLWFYAAGYIGLNKVNSTQMEDLTGFSFSIQKNEHPMVIRTEPQDLSGSDPILFGVKKPQWPRFSVVPDKDVEVLGRWADTGEVAFARKKCDGWTSIYVGAAPLPTVLLRSIAREAGCRFWSTEHDLVSATEDTTMIVATTEGKRTVSLHKSMRRFGTDEVGDTFHLEATFGDVELFFKSP
jgi:hypothetical protein